MEDGNVVSGCSSVCFTGIYQPKHSGFYEDCKTLKCELQKTHDELKLAQFITDLLVKEINFTKASIGASTNRYQSKYDAELAVMKVMELVLMTGFQ
jgi:hypothetical protein